VELRFADRTRAIPTAGGREPLAERELLAHRRDIERHDGDVRPLEDLHLARLHAQGRRDLLRCRGAPVPALEAIASVAVAPHPIEDVGRQADRARVALDRADTRLLDPPDPIGRESVAAPLVELLDRAEQSKVALLDQVEERNAHVAEAFRLVHDQAQVVVDEAIPCRPTPREDLLRALEPPSQCPSRHPHLRRELPLRRATAWLALGQPSKLLEHVDEELVRRLDAGDAPSDATIDRIEHAAGGPSPSGLVTPQQQPGGAAECAVDEGTSVPGGGAVVELAELPGDTTRRLQPSPSLEQLSSGEGDRSEFHQELLACRSKAPCQVRFLVGREERNLPDLVQVAP
jgi:hypothetical protein